MNRLRLRAIPKLDLTTYLVFSYCKESTPGVDLYRFWIASTWARSRKDVLVPFDSIRENVVQIQELIQCVVSALDNVDLRRLVAKTERRNKKNLQADYRPVCNFSMLHSVMKWEVATSCVPRATEWFSYNDSEDTPGDLHNLNSLRNLLEAKRTTTNISAVKHGPSDPDLCGACLVDANSEDGNKLMALDACSHWFCEQCWKSRLLRQLKKADPAGDDIARCVELGCDNPVDSVTLLTLLSVEKIRSMVESKIRGRVASLAPHVVMCPNESCRQVFTITRGDHTSKSEDAIPVVCPCSCQFCSSCLESPHWPASCDLSVRYNEIIVQRGDNSMLLRMLLDNEFPEDLLSGRKCFNCGRFVRQFVFRKTEPNEFGRPLCLQCAKEDHQNNNESLNSVANSNYVSQTNNANFQSSQTITKWYKIATAHRKMRHPEVVKALYAMADTVAQKLVCAVTAGKYVGDSKRAATEWDDFIFEWAEENYRTLCKVQADISTEDSGVSSSDKHKSFESTETSSRATSASSRYSTSSLAHYTEHALSDTSVAATRLSAPLGFDKSEVCLEMTRAAYNIVQLKLELHQIAEYMAVLLDYQVTLRGKLIRCLERAEDLCSSLGILLHDPHVHNAGSFREMNAAKYRLLCSLPQILQVLSVDVELD
ncbi:E3 ubiquitin-protein ligase arih1 [Plakobranchus ocellatus]|uniref:RBR-type E3 ubiquitin transferase n=1 Tax=Plakobranchus ocellatus TaxID=259542 RepID=A0AAV4AK26_9GAST|nr:E3 ubiquitin-protein ligase arih1 [Plakobranchus ocellatus]